MDKYTIEAKSEDGKFRIGAVLPSLAAVVEWTMARKMDSPDCGLRLMTDADISPCDVAMLRSMQVTLARSGSLLRPQ